RLRSLLMTQWWLTAWGTAIFGNFAGPGLLLNPVLGIVFPLVALCAGIDLVSDWWLAEIILTVFVGTMTNIGSFALENPMTSLCWMDVASPIRFALLVAAVPATLNALSNLSIRDDERRRRRKIDVRHPMARPKRIDCG